MRKLLSLTVLVMLMSVMTIQVALAAPPEEVIEDQGLVSTCQKGADNARVGQWEHTTLEELTAMYRDIAPEWVTDDQVAAAATATFDFCNHNRDEFVCSMTQLHPNGAPGYGVTILSLDNHYSPAK